LKTLLILAACLVLAGCATALKQEGRCLESLTPEYLKAQEELDHLEASWHASSQRRNAELNTGVLVEYRPAASSDSLEDYRKLVEARAVHGPLLKWYDRVYKRVRTRMDEEEILTNVQMVLITNPGVVFYPLIRWNIHNVFWDGADPDAATDPVTQYCQERLGNVAAAAPTHPAGME
jgi:hypothetical protein